MNHFGAGISQGHGSSVWMDAIHVWIDGWMDGWMDGWALYYDIFVRLYDSVWTKYHVHCTRQQ